MEKKKIIMIAGGVLLIGGIAYFVYSNKKKKEVELLKAKEEEEEEELASLGLDSEGNSMPKTSEPTEGKKIAKPTLSTTSIIRKVKPRLAGAMTALRQLVFKVERVGAMGIMNKQTVILGRPLPTGTRKGTNIQLNIKKPIGTGTTTKMGKITRLESPTRIEIFPRLSMMDAKNLTSIILK